VKSLAVTKTSAYCLIQVVGWVVGCNLKRRDYNKTYFYITIVSEHIDSVTKKKRKHAVKMRLREFNSALLLKT